MHGLARRPLAAYTVSEGQAGQRLDLFLKGRIPKLSRTGIQRVIRARVALPGRVALPKPSLVMRHGDVVVLFQADHPEAPIAPELTPRLLYLDDHLLAVDKPPGLAVHATRHAVRAHLIHWIRERYSGRLALAHRIDRETSGVVLCTRSTAAARRLGDDFAHGRVHKQYLAVVDGEPPPSGRIDSPVGPATDSKIYIKQGCVSGAPAATRYLREMVSLDRSRSLVRAFPETGRRHQIRVHLAALGHPVIGDKLYRFSDRFFLRYIARGLDDQMLAAVGADRHLLHAAVLELTHPVTGRLVRIEAALPADFGSGLGTAREP